MLYQNPAKRHAPCSKKEIFKQKRHSALPHFMRKHATTRYSDTIFAFMTSINSQNWTCCLKLIETYNKSISMVVLEWILELSKPEMHGNMFFLYSLSPSLLSLNINQKLKLRKNISESYSMQNRIRAWSRKLP